MPQFEVGNVAGLRTDPGVTRVVQYMGEDNLGRLLFEDVTTEEELFGSPEDFSVPVSSLEIEYLGDMMLVALENPAEHGFGFISLEMVRTKMAEDLAENEPWLEHHPSNH
jgi:hypothetical protein